MPTSVIILYAVLVGYPALSLVFAVYVRRRRRRLTALRRELLADEVYQDARSQKVICDFSSIESRWKNAFVLTAPIAVPAMVIATSLGLLLKGERKIVDIENEIEQSQQEFKEIRQTLAKAHGHEIDGPIWADDRLWDAQNQVFEIEMLRFPLTAILTGLAALVTLPFAFIAYGIHSVPTFFRFMLQKLALNLGLQRFA